MFFSILKNPQEILENKFADDDKESLQVRSDQEEDIDQSSQPENKDYMKLDDWVTNIYYIDDRSQKAPAVGLRTKILNFRGGQKIIFSQKR